MNEIGRVFKNEKDHDKNFVMVFLKRCFLRKKLFFNLFRELCNAVNCDFDIFKRIRGREAKISFAVFSERRTGKTGDPAFNKKPVCELRA